MSAIPDDLRTLVAHPDCLLPDSRDLSERLVRFLVASSSARSSRLVLHLAGACTHYVKPTEEDPHAQMI